MKSMLAAFAILLTLSACSKKKNDPPVIPLTPFQKASDGKWLSECQSDNTGNYRITLVLNRTTGSTTTNYYQATDCSGAIIKTDPPLNFTYTSVNKAGGKDGEGTVTITVPGQPPVSVEVTIQGNKMVVISPTGVMIYERVVEGGPGKQGNPLEAFDAVARGNWESRDCRQVPGGGSFRQVVSIQGGGNAQSVTNVYPDNACQGVPNAQNPQGIVYTVLNFANGSGKITVNGQARDVTVSAAQLTVGGEVYLRSL